jgi:uncharacterized membrane protein
VLQTVADAAVALVWLGVAVATMFLPAGSPVRVFAALTVLLLLPGYALTTALFPATTAGRTERSQVGTVGARSATPFSGESDSQAAVSNVKRAALSFGLSLASLPLIGFVAEVVFGSYEVVPLLAVLTVFIVAVFGVGVYRRLGVPADERYVLPVGRWLKGAEAGFVRTEGFDRMLNIGLAVVVVLSMGVAGVALVAPQEGDGYTEVAVLAQQPDGDWAAKNYPTAMQAEEPVPVMLTVSNDEREPVEYTVVVALQRLEDNGTVTEYRELQRFWNRVSPGETWRNPHEVTPTMFGDQLRLVYLVYRGEPPSTPSVANAYRHVSFRVSVST